MSAVPRPLAEPTTYPRVRVSLPARLLLAGYERAAARRVPWSTYLAQLVWADLELPGELPVPPNAATTPRTPSTKVTEAAASSVSVDVLTTFPDTLLTAGKVRQRETLHPSWSSYLAALVRADLAGGKGPATVERAGKPSDSDGLREKRRAAKKK